MTITTEQLVAYMNDAKLGFRVQHPEQDIVVGFPTDHYRSHLTGVAGATLVARVDLEGTYVIIYAPQVFTLEGAAFEQAALRSLVELGWRARPVQIAIDDRDDEIRFSINLPVFDGTLTADQFVESVRRLAWVVDEFAPVFRAACETGQIDWSTFGERDPEPDDVKLEDMELADMMRRVGGVEGLRTLLGQSGLGEDGGCGEQRVRTASEGGEG